MLNRPSGLFFRSKKKYPENTTEYQKQRFLPKIKNIFVKNLLLMFLVITVPILLVVGISYYSIREFYKNEINAYSVQFIESLENTTERVIDECISQMNYLSSDFQVSVFLRTNSNHTVYYDNNYLQKIIRLQLFTRDYLDSIYLYSDFNKMIISPSGVRNYSNAYDSGWLDLYLNHQGEGNIWLELRTDVQDFASLSGKDYLSIYMKVNYGDSHTGVIIFNIDWEKFCTMLNDHPMEPDNSLGITDPDNAFITSVYGDCEKHLTPETLSLLGNETNYINTGDRILYKASFVHTDWSYVLSVPASAYQAEIQPVLNIMILIISLGLLLTLIMTIVVSLRIYQPFKNILALFQQPVNYVEENTELYHDQESYILSSIQKSIRENEQISAELEKRIVLLKKAQHTALQSQINPHFLYNTLDAINWMAMRLTGGRNEASIMISKLAAMLRYSLENPEALVSLDTELENVRVYLELQMLRYKGLFTVEWDIDETLKKQRVIKLILQPIVENCIYHGLRPLNKSGKIKISAHTDGNHLLLEIEDTGVGISRQSMEKINHTLSCPGISTEEHIGMHNVNQRITLLFGDEYHLKIDSREGEWTRVFLTLPLLDQNDTVS